MFENPSLPPDLARLLDGYARLLDQVDDIGYDEAVAALGRMVVTDAAGRVWRVNEHATLEAPLFERAEPGGVFQLCDPNAFAVLDTTVPPAAPIQPGVPLNPFGQTPIQPAAQQQPAAAGWSEPQTLLTPPSPTVTSPTQNAPGAVPLVDSSPGLTNMFSSDVPPARSLESERSGRQLPKFVPKLPEGAVAALQGRGRTIGVVVCALVLVAAAFLTRGDTGSPATENLGDTSVGYGCEPSTATGAEGEAAELLGCLAATEPAGPAVAGLFLDDGVFTPTAPVPGQDLYAAVARMVAVSGEQVPSPIPAPEKVTNFDADYTDLLGLAEAFTLTGAATDMKEPVTRSQLIEAAHATLVRAGAVTEATDVTAVRASLDDLGVTFGFPSNLDGPATREEAVIVLGRTWFEMKNPTQLKELVSRPVTASPTTVPADSHGFPATPSDEQPTAPGAPTAAETDALLKNLVSGEGDKYASVIVDIDPDKAGPAARALAAFLGDELTLVFQAAPAPDGPGSAVGVLQSKDVDGNVVGEVTVQLVFTDGTWKLAEPPPIL